jgi:hypothetical protein
MGKEGQQSMLCRVIVIANIYRDKLAKVQVYEGADMGTGCIKVDWRCGGAECQRSLLSSTDCEMGAGTEGNTAQILSCTIMGINMMRVRPVSKDSFSWKSLAGFVVGLLVWYSPALSDSRFYYCRGKGPMVVWKQKHEGDATW